jgi:hypothetical protein
MTSTTTLRSSPAQTWSGFALALLLAVTGSALSQEAVQQSPPTFGVHRTEDYCRCSQFRRGSMKRICAIHHQTTLAKQRHDANTKYVRRRQLGPGVAP